MISTKRQWTRLAFRYLGHALLASLVGLIAFDIFSYANENKVKYLIINLGAVVAYVSVNMYRRTADRFLDRMAAKWGWRPFTSDLVNLVCYGAIVAVPVLVTFGISFSIPLNSAPGM